MSKKLIALGNVLMGDDGIAVAVAGILEQDLNRLGFEVIYGETDIGYCITKIKDGDFLIILDASLSGKRPGEITILPYNTASKEGTIRTQHGLRFTDLLDLYFPAAERVILTIEAAKVSLNYQLSRILSDKINIIAEETLQVIHKVINVNQYGKN
jgi:hydrogenase maturation protease